MKNHSEKVQALPLHTVKFDPFVQINRIYAVMYTLGIITLFYHHYLQLLSSTTVISFTLTLSFFFADIVLAFMWALNQAYHWRPIHRQTHPERLPTKELLGMDVFICTADPYKEPPMGVVNAALSVMAYDYPMEKLSVYLSDDGGSDLTLFAFMEAAEFAKHWIPFCKMNDIMMRSPQAYFDSNIINDDNKIKVLYEKMKGKVEAVMTNGRVEEHHLQSEIEHRVFQKWEQERFTRHEHPSVIQILLESSKDRDITDQPLPNLIYISREKRRSVHHHFKGGSLNALLRVSKVMTNAPFILTLDCDMISNDPITPRRAMCFLLDEAMSENLAYVQFPQRFRGINESDIYGNEYRSLTLIKQFGFDGIKGPNYLGTNTFFRRRAIEGLPNCEEVLMKSSSTSITSTMVLDLASKMIGATFEENTRWGCEIGFRYGSLAEDFYTGYRLQCEGWQSMFCNPKRPAFLGEAIHTLHDGLNQVKRWTIGLFEVAFTKHKTFTYGIKHGSLLFAMGHTHNSLWGIPFIPIMFYGIVPQIILIHQLPVNVLPKVHDPWFLLYISLFMVAYTRDMVDFLRSDHGSFSKWWNDQRMWLIRGVTSYPLGITEALIKQMGFHNIGFEVTSKVTEKDANNRYKKGIFDFGVESVFMISLGLFASMSLVAFIVGFSRILLMADTRFEESALPLLLCGFVIVNCWPIYEAMTFRKDSGSIPSKCVKLSISIAFALYFIIMSLSFF